jgi:hypothetical protein
MPITDCGRRLHSKWRTTRPKRHAIVPNSKPITQSSDPRDLDPGKKTAGGLKNGPGNSDQKASDFFRNRSASSTASSIRPGRSPAESKVLQIASGAGRCPAVATATRVGLGVGIALRFPHLSEKSCSGAIDEREMGCPIVLVTRKSIASLKMGL